MVRPAGKVAFEPERCPWRSCPRHAQPTPRFFVRYGSYWGSKGKRSPLFGVNHMAAKVRYGAARLIRRTWCASKKRERLAMHLAMYWMWHNAWRWRTNKADTTPGMEEGLWSRRLSLRELLGFRQDWGALSRKLDAA